MTVDALGIIRQIEADPGLRAQLRAVLLSEEVLRLPELVAENSRDIRDLKESLHSVEVRLVSVEQSQARMEQSQERLEQSQERLEQGQERLERSHESLRQEVGRLSGVVGGTVESDAASVVVTVLERRGYQMRGEPEPLEVNGEIDVFVDTYDSEGASVAALVEAKTRLRPADVRRFAGTLDVLLATAGITGAFIPYVYGLRVYDGVVDAAKELKLGVLCPDGERLPGAVRER
ncbi:MAG: hypothetical protein M0008_04315 [Actinomycetota bacterium]|nr:hypothetical protein [Actinomycetota bacterium]